jgi:hypothetical protein
MAIDRDYLVFKAIAQRNINAVIDLDARLDDRLHYSWAV